MQVGGGSGYKAEINVTPLVDVVLVLLIIFMVVTPMLQSGLAVELPEARNVAEKKSQREQVLITVAVSGQFFYEDEAVNKDGLLTKVKDRLSYNPGLELLVKGDRRLDYSNVRDVMMALREAGAKSVVLATKERKDKAN
ncbi:MAG: biopolymer transporter ExbD [Pseudomonadota bacterium]